MFKLSLGRLLFLLMIFLGLLATAFNNQMNLFPVDLYSFHPAEKINLTDLHAMHRHTYIHTQICTCADTSSSTYAPTLIQIHTRTHLYAHMLVFTFTLSSVHSHMHKHTLTITE